MSDKSDTGGSAFPIVGDYGLRMENSEGMTLRDYFAAKAMIGYVMDEAIAKDTDTHQEWLKTIAEASYELADAMLKARKS